MESKVARSGDAMECTPYPFGVTWFEDDRTHHVASYSRHAEAVESVEALKHGQAVAGDMEGDRQ